LFNSISSSTLRIVSPPSNLPYGSPGDQQGDIAFDSKFIYYSTGSYSTVNVSIYNEYQVNGGGGGFDHIEAQVTDASQLTKGKLYATQMVIGNSSPSVVAIVPILSYSYVSGNEYRFYFSTSSNVTGTLSGLQIFYTPPIWETTPFNAITSSTFNTGTLVTNAVNATTSSYVPAAGITGNTLPSTLYYSSLQSVGNLTNLQINGNLNFSGSQLRIQGDFDNTTVINRLAFVTNNANTSTGIYALPNGTSQAASWQAINNSDPTNASKILIATNGTTDVQLVSGVNGTGTYLPLSFYNGGIQQMRLGTTGILSLNSTATSTSTTTGALTVVGGVGIGGALYTGGNINAGSNSVIAGTIQGNAYSSGGFGSSTAVGFLGMPQNNQTGTTYTLALIDQGKHIYATNATLTVTVPANSSIPFPIGSAVTIISGSTSTVSIAINTDTMIFAGYGTTGTRTLAPYGMASLVKITTSTWMISGAGLS
jgi:hypothetical protein